MHTGSCRLKYSCLDEPTDDKTVLTSDCTPTVRFAPYANQGIGYFPLAETSFNPTWATGGVFYVQEKVRAGTAREAGLGHERLCSG